METNPNNRLVGGIAKVILHHPFESLSEVEVGDESVGSVTPQLILSSCSYLEERLCEDCGSGVKHTLTLAIQHECPPYGDSTFQDVIRDGVVADITLATGEVIRVGWSERYGVSSPMRLESVNYESGKLLSDNPSRVWMLSSIDTTPFFT